MPHLILTLDPVLFRLGSVTIHYYGLLLVGSIIIAYWWLRRSFPQPWLLDLYLISLAGALIGARVLFESLHWLEKSTTALPPQSVLELVNSGGLSFHGALIGGIFAATWYAKQHQIMLMPIFDRLSLVLPIAIFLVRIGNLINQELIGRPTDRLWGVVFPLVDSVPRHPVQLYEAAIALIVGCILWWVGGSTRRVWGSSPFGWRSRQSGDLALYFLLLYSIGRLTTDFFREQSTLIGPLSLAQWTSIGIILIIVIINVKSVEKKYNN